jgi:hypothetical protein
MGCARATLARWWKCTSRTGFEVEFVTAFGRTAVVLTLTAQDVRPVADDDLISVRQLAGST